MCTIFSKGDNYSSAKDVKNKTKQSIEQSKYSSWYFIRQYCSFSLYLHNAQRSVLFGDHCTEVFRGHSPKMQQKSCWSLGLNLISLQTMASGCPFLSFSELLLLFLTYRTTFNPGNHLSFILKLTNGLSFVAKCIHSLPCDCSHGWGMLPWIQVWGTEGKAIHHGYKLGCGKRNFH